MPKLRLFRFMHDEKYAEAFLQGEIFVSTFQRCRAFENPAQGDPREGHLTYRFNGRADSRDSTFASRIQRLNGVSITGPIIDSYFDIRSTTVVPDAFVLCMTSTYDPDVMRRDFGHFCIEIAEPSELFEGLSRAIRKEHHVYEGRRDQVSYQGTHYSNDDAHPGEMCFIKDDQFAWQKEHRFVWVPVGQQKLAPQPFKIRRRYLRALIKRW